MGSWTNSSVSWASKVLLFLLIVKHWKPGNSCPEMGNHADNGLSRRVPFTDPSVSVLITNSNVKHQLTGSEYPERRSACLESAVVLGKESLRDVSLAMLEENKDKFDEVTFRRVKHVVTEIPR